MYFEQHYDKYDHCYKCERKYLEVNLIANYNSSRKRSNYYCIRCYNRREIDETKETVNETLQRRIKKSVTGTTDPERVSNKEEVGQIKNNNEQALWFVINVKEMDMLDYRLKQKRSLNSVRFVTHKGKSMKISTTTKHGQRGLIIPSQSTMVHPLTQNVSKTTRFRMSKPVIEFKGEPPF